VIGYGLDGQGFKPGRGKRRFLFPKASRPALGTEFLTGGKSSRGVKLNTHFYLILRLRMSGAVHLLPLCAFMECTCVQLKHSEFRQSIPVSLNASVHQFLVIGFSACFFVLVCIFVW